MSESIRSIPNFVTRAVGLRRRAARPTAREWARHTLFFLLTGVTMTWAGMSFLLRPDAAETNLAAPVTPLEYLLYVPKYYVLALAAVASYALAHPDRKSTRLNSSHEWISYAGFCLKQRIAIHAGGGGGHPLADQRPGRPAARRGVPRLHGAARRSLADVADHSEN